MATGSQEWRAPRGARDSFISPAPPGFLVLVLVIVSSCMKMTFCLLLSCHQ